MMVIFFSYSHVVEAAARTAPGEGVGVPQILQTGHPLNVHVDPHWQGAQIGLSV
jgi:hypothetical protein